MKWRELRAFLNMKFDDEDSISLSTDIAAARVVVLKNPHCTNNGSLLFIDENELGSFRNYRGIDSDEITPSIFTDIPNSAFEYSENEISTYFGGFNKMRK